MTTLEQIVNDIMSISSNEPNIGYVGEGDIYDLNGKPDIDYSVIYITQNAHSIDSERNIINYSFNIFYVDRVLPDLSNVLSIQSDGMQVLVNIVNTIMNDDKYYINGDISFQPFIQRFKDDCAGIYLTINLSVGNGQGTCIY